jgi:colanic acid/amylovoran biosynthesis glycosyltransferase
MKVLFCTNSFELITNGPAKFANLLWRIGEQYPDIEMRILTEDISEPRERVYKMEVRYSPVFRYLGQVIRIFLYRKNIRCIRKTFDYDILVFNHSFHGLAISFGENKPIIGMINDDNSCSRNWSNFSLTKDWLSYFVYGKLEKWSIKRFNSILANSLFLRRTLVNDYNLDDSLAQKILLFYKAVEIENQPAPFRPIGERVKVLFVKRDFVRGGLGILAKALGSLTQFQIELTIIGPEERFFYLVEDLVGKHAHVKVNLLGYRDAAYVQQAMFNHDIFCVPSTLEALGVANLEALSRGISVISSDAGGIPEVLDHGNCGWMAPVGNHEALASAFEACISNEALRRLKRANGLQYAQNFDVRLMYERFRQILETNVGS